MKIVNNSDIYWEIISDAKQLAQNTGHTTRLLQYYHVNVSTEYCFVVDCDCYI